MAKKEVVKVDIFKKFEDLIPEEKTIDFNGVQIKVKQYLDIKDKQVIIGVVKDMAFREDEVGIEQFDQINIDIALVYSILKHYTNIILPTNDDYKTYNIAIGSGLYGAVREAIPASELEYIEGKANEFIVYRLEEIMNRSQLAEQLQEIVYGAIERFPKENEMKDIIKKLKGVDQDKIKFFKEAFDINKNGKPKEK